MFFRQAILAGPARPPAPGPAEQGDFVRIFHLPPSLPSTLSLTPGLELRQVLGLRVEWGLTLPNTVFGELVVCDSELS